MVNIMIGSMTYAMKGRELLLRRGISSEVRRAPAFLSRKGCGFALALRRAELAQALAVLTEAGITPRSVWEQQTNGGYRELRGGGAR